MFISLFTIPLSLLDKKLPSFQLFHVWSWVVFIASKMQINIHKEDLHPFMFWRDFIFWHIRFSIIVFWRVFLFFRPELVTSWTCLGWGYKLFKSFFFPNQSYCFMFWVNRKLRVNLIEATPSSFCFRSSGCYHVDKPAFVCRTKLWLSQVPASQVLVE